MRAGLPIVLVACTAGGPIGADTGGAGAGDLPAALPWSDAYDTGAPSPDLTVDLGPEVRCADPSLRTTEGPLTEILPAGDLADDPFDPDHESLYTGGGLTVADLDGDGRQDLLTGGEDAAHLYLQQADGTFVDASDRLPVADRVNALTPADVDDDGDLDLFVARDTVGNQLWIQDAGVFVDTTADAGVAGGEGDAGRTAAGTFGDVDGDGILDLFVATHGGLRNAGADPAPPDHLYLGRGDGTFVEASDRIPQAVHDGWTFVGSLLDLDEDGDLDLYVVNDFGNHRPNTLAWNEGGTFVADDGALGLHVGLQGMGLGVGDLDGDGIRDLVMAGWGDNRAMLFLQGRFYDIHAAVGIDGDRRAGQVVGWATEVADLDHDGDDDIVEGFGDIWNQRQPDAQADEIFLNDGGPFRAVGADWGFDHPGQTRGVAVADIDGDGWYDLARNDLVGPATYQRARCGSRHWVRFRLEQPAPNRNAIGASVAIVAEDRVKRRDIHAGGTSVMTAVPAVATFGLGQVTRLERVFVRWPDGRVDRLGPLPVDREIVVRRTAR